MKLNISNMPKHLRISTIPSPFPYVHVVHVKTMAVWLSLWIAHDFVFMPVLMMDNWKRIKSLISIGQQSVVIVSMNKILFSNTNDQRWKFPNQLNYKHHLDNLCWIVSNVFYENYNWMIKQIKAIVNQWNSSTIARLLQQWLFSIYQCNLFYHGDLI